MYDYTNPDGVKLSAYSHMIELSKQLKSTLELLSPEEIAENADTIEEVAHILQVLADHNPDDIITLFYADGLNCFEIIDN